MGKLTHIPAFLFTCFLALTASAQPIKIWDGGASGNWSNGNNWQDGSPPSGGEQLRFPENASQPLCDDQQHRQPDRTQHHFY